MAVLEKLEALFFLICSKSQIQPKTDLELQKLCVKLRKTNCFMRLTVPSFSQYFCFCSSWFSDDVLWLKMMI